MNSIPPGPFRVVAADVSHVGFLSAFGRDAFIEAYAGTLPLKELAAYTETAFNPSSIQDEIENATATYFVGLDAESKPCGYAKLLPSPPPVCIARDGSIELQRLYVDSSHKGMGIGRLLALHAEAHAIRQGFRTIWLRVWDGNLAARNIYLKWNYAELGAESYKVGQEQRTVILMAKPLQPIR